MDGESVRETIEADVATQLDRFGSGKLLIALTCAELDPDPVLAVAASRERAAADTFDGWAENESLPAAAEEFAERARRHRERAEQVRERMDEPSTVGETAPLVLDAARFDGTADRIGGAIGHALLDERVHVQFVSFFVNEADTGSTELFRSFREAAAAAVDDLVALLDEVPPSGDERSDAREAAVSVIESAYDDYVNALDELGIDPKPVC